MKPLDRHLADSSVRDQSPFLEVCSNLADAIPLGVVLVDGVGNVLHFNGAFHNLFPVSHSRSSSPRLSSIFQLSDEEWTILWRESSTPGSRTLRCLLFPGEGKSLTLSVGRVVSEERELMVLVVLNPPSGNGFPGSLKSPSEAHLRDWAIDLEASRRNLDHVPAMGNRSSVEKSLRESEERYRTLLDNTRDVVYRVNVATRRYEYISPSSTSVLGFSPGECMDAAFRGGRDQVHPDDLPLYEKSMAAAVSLIPGGVPDNIEYRWRHANGQYRWLSDTRSVIRDAGGNPVAIVGSLRDITDRKSFIEDLTRANYELQWEINQRREVQRALQESEIRYRAIVEDQMDLVCRFKSDGTISFVNEAYCAFFGLSGIDCVGRAYTALVYPDDYSMVQTQIGNLTPVQPSVTIENRVVRGDGETRWVQWTIHALYNETGTLVEFQSAGRDITEKKNAEQLLAAQYEITSVLAEPSTVAGAMRKVLESLSTRFEWDLVALWTREGGREATRLELLCRPQHAARSLTVPKTGVPEQVLRDKRLEWRILGAGEDHSIHAAGFQTLVAFPVRAGNDLTAVIECFSHEKRQRRADLAETMEAIGHQIGNYRQRRAAEESLRKAAEELEEKVHQRTEQLANALKALSNSEQRFRTMIESAPLGIVLLNNEGVITERNQSLERMLGYAEGGLFSARFEMLVVTEDREKVKDLLHNSQEIEPGQDRVEVRFMRTDADIVWGSVSSSSVTLGGHEPDFTIVMIKDVTERKVMEEELRRSEDQFRTVFEEAPIGIALLDANGRYVRTNQALNEMLRYPPGKLDGMSLADIVHPADLEEDRQKLREMVEGRCTRYHLEKRYIRSDGTMAWGNLNGTAVLADNGDFLYCLRIVEDITQKKETEQQIHMLAHTVTSMNECVIITDAAYRILTVNKAFTRTFGFEQEEVRSQNVGVLVGRASRRARIKDLIEGTLRGGWTGELSVLRKGGAMFPILLSTSVVRDEHGNPIALVGIARDITEQKRLHHMLAETERRRSEDLRRFAISVQKAQEEERQRIARDLHDDICQRLSGMKLNMEVLEDEIHGSDRKTSRVLRGFRKQLEHTISEVRRLSSNLRPTVLDDFGLTIAMNLLVREFEKTHGVNVQLESKHLSARHLDPQVEIALYRIAQESLANIAQHARATSVTIQLQCRDRLAELVVKDNGQGFNEAEVSNAKEVGHGMGLISMRERAELLGGKCLVTSTQHDGTTVHVAIPLEGSFHHEENADSHRG